MTYPDGAYLPPAHRHDAEEASKEAARAEQFPDAIKSLVEASKATARAEFRARAAEQERDELRAEAERLTAAAKPAVDYCLEQTYTLLHSDLETHCIRLVVRDLGIADAELERLRDSHATTAEALARAVAHVTPCSCSAQRARAEAAEAKVARVEALAEQWEEATIWPDKPHRSLRGAAARLRIALSGPTETGDDRG